MYLVIGKNNCPACEATKQKLESKNIPYVYKNITSTDIVENEIFTKLLVEEIGVRSVPLVLKVIGDYSAFEKSLQW